MKYQVTFFKPGSAWKEDAIAFFESEMPFMSIHKDDLIDPYLWDGEALSALPSKRNVLLRVVNVIHQVGAIRGVAYHTVKVYSELVDNSEDVILQSS